MTANREECRAVVYRGPGEPLRIEQVSLPRLAEGEVLVRIRCCTLCGSDLHTYSGRRGTPTPTILGHEILGEVVDCGGSVSGFEGKPLGKGERVTWSIAASCGDCFYCRHDLPQKCEHLFKYGHEKMSAAHPLSGGLAEYCHLARGTAIVRIPDELPDEAACPVNCATATVAAALRYAGLAAGETVLIQGAGMLGLTAAAMAARLGAREVLVCDVDPGRLALAARFGATQTIDVSAGEETLRKSVASATDGRGVDVAIELSGAPNAMADGLATLRIGGRYILVGAVFPAPPVPVDAESIVRRLIRIQGLHNYTPQDLAAAVAFLKDSHERYPFEELVEKRYTLDEAPAAFQEALDQRMLRVAVVP